jgi:hypothetical protein
VKDRGARWSFGRVLPPAEVSDGLVSAAWSRLLGAGPAGLRLTREVAGRGPSVEHGGRRAQPQPKFLKQLSATTDPEFGAFPRGVSGGGLWPWVFRSTYG